MRESELAARPKFSLHETDRWAKAVWPRGLWARERVESALDEVGIEVTSTLTEGDVTTTIELSSETNVIADVLDRLFGRLNDVPTLPARDLSRFHQSARPLISCAIILTANDLFVQRQALPRLMHSLRGTAAEIIVVFNGLGSAPVVDLGDVRIVSSPIASVPAAYNRAIEESKGEYVALFHDDCLVADPDWVDKTLEKLGEGATVVTAEMRRDRLPPLNEPLSIAKCVPLVMRRASGLRFDHHYLLGFEDLDFTHQVLASGGVVGEVDLNVLHFGGMSTVLVGAAEASQCRRMFGHLMIPIGHLKKMNDLAQASVMANPKLRRLGWTYISYFLEKFQSYLGTLYADRVDDAIARLREVRANGAELEALENSYREYFRAALQRAQTPSPDHDLARVQLDTA